MAEPILTIEHVSKTFAAGQGVLSSLGLRRERLHAVTDVSLEITEGETFGLVGESGCGKSTLARLIVQLHEPDSGRIRFRGVDRAAISGAARRKARPQIQMVFQDPYSSLNPRMSVGSALAEPLRVHRIVPGEQVDAEVGRLLDRVGLPGTVADRFPRELSGGQRQRVGIARALSVRPELVVADEAVSGLDVSIRAQVLDLLADLHDELRLTLLFISHDLSVVEFLSDRVGVMYLGRLVELAPALQLFAAPGHPYSVGLMAAIPSVDPSVRTATAAVRGELPSPIHPPTGCVFRTRCPLAQAICATPPPEVELGPGHWAACHFAADVRASGKSALPMAPALPQGGEPA
jgi:oligopeptide/dipeptide ABC transporter ATP-binding protein